MAKAKIQSTTQGFTEVEDIKDGILFLKGNNAASILEVSSVNFFLLSTEEQNARIYGFMSFLNSLSSAIQIFIVSKKVDMTEYLSMLESKIEKTQDPNLSEHLIMYKQFIQELVKGENLLDKKIYVVIPFSSLELGPITNKKMTLQDRIKEAVNSKQAGVLSQIQRMGLSARPLESSEVAKVLYELYNQETVSLDFQSDDITNIIL